MTDGWTPAGKSASSGPPGREAGRSPSSGAAGSEVGAAAASGWVCPGSNRRPGAARGPTAPARRGRRGLRQLVSRSRSRRPADRRGHPDLGRNRRPQAGAHNRAHPRGFAAARASVPTRSPPAPSRPFAAPSPRSGPRSPATRRRIAESPESPKRPAATTHRPEQPGGIPAHRARELGRPASHARAAPRVRPRRCRRWSRALQRCAEPERVRGRRRRLGGPLSDHGPARRAARCHPTPRDAHPCSAPARHGKRVAPARTRGGRRVRRVSTASRCTDDVGSSRALRRCTRHWPRGARVRDRRRRSRFRHAQRRRLRFHLRLRLRLDGRSGVLGHGALDVRAELLVGGNALRNRVVVPRMPLDHRAQGARRVEYRKPLQDGRFRCPREGPRRRESGSQRGDPGSHLVLAHPDDRVEHRSLHVRVRPDHRLRQHRQVVVRRVLVRRRGSGETRHVPAGAVRVDDVRERSEEARVLP